MDTSLHIHALEIEIKRVDLVLGQKSKVYQKMMDDLSTIKYEKSKEHFVVSLNKNIDKVLAEIMDMNQKLTIMKASLESLTRSRDLEIMKSMVEWRSKTINPFSNPSLAGILQNPFLVSPATN